MCPENSPSSKVDVGKWIFWDVPVVFQWVALFHMFGFNFKFGSKGPIQIPQSVPASPWPIHKTQSSALRKKELFVHESQRQVVRLLSIYF